VAEYENQRNPQFRQDLAKIYGEGPPGSVAHHNFPVEYSGKFQQLGIDTKNAAWGSWVNESDHIGFTPELRKDWDSFWNTPQMRDATQVGPTRRRWPRAAMRVRLRAQHGKQVRVPGSLLASTGGQIIRQRPPARW